MNELFEKIEGRDEYGIPKAICNLNILMPDDNGDPDIIRTANTLNGTVALSIIPDGISAVDVVFENETDYDYLQFSTLCEEHFKQVSDAMKNDGIVPSLTLSICPRDDIGEFLQLMNCQWSYIPVSQDGKSSGIRFIAMPDCVFVTEIPDEVFEAVAEDIAAENV